MGVVVGDDDVVGVVAAVAAAAASYDGDDIVAAAVAAAAAVVMVHGREVGVAPEAQVVDVGRPGWMMSTVEEIYRTHLSRNARQGRRYPR